ncbi:ABC transporter substrate-binding protein [Neobacillus novalis]|uniref:ABC transporter substrate-binding protein n=1 Tax=Neobacillus novalis TaxID=220687 RepID=A0AA95SAZ8_9BACI|nr:ABC transporter substrate-binding protein [Neobacillus novalis]WHY85979.1 ABC transporter substrate-binding protein [Neobacillus novalis]
MKSKVLAFFLIVFLVLAGCTSSKSKDNSTASSEKKRDSLVVAQASDAGTLDPQKQGKMPDMNILINMFDTLLTRDENNKLAPGLATEWKAIDDTTWQFKLRKDVKFHNGEPFNAEAVKFSIDRLNNPDTKSPIVELKTVKEVVVIDEYTVNLVTSASDPILPNKTVLFGGVMVPPNYIKEKGDDYFAQHPVGTGPYKFVSWQKDHQVVMEANPDYFRGAPKMKKLTFRVIPNLADMVAATKTGEVDIATSLTPDVATQLKSDSNVNVISTPWIRTFYMVIDTTKEGPMAKKEVRQAMNYAVNVKQIIDTVLGGHAQRVATIVPSQNFGVDKSIKPFKYNIEKAKKLLAQAGYPDGFSTEMDANNLDVDIVQAIAAELGKVGIKVKVNLMDGATLTNNIAAKKASPLYYLGNTGWTMDALSNFQSYIKSDRRYNAWKNAEADKLVDIEEQSIDSKTRLDAFSQIQKLLIDESPYLFLYQLDGLYGMSKDVEWKPNVMGVLNMYNASIK